MSSTRLPTLQKKIIQSKKVLKNLAFQQDKYERKLNQSNLYASKVYQNHKKIDYMHMKVSQIQQLPNQQTILNSILHFQKECVKAKINNFYSYYFISNVKYVPRQKAEKLIQIETDYIKKGTSSFHKINDLILGRQRYLNILKKLLEEYNDVLVFKHINQLQGKSNQVSSQKQLIENVYSKIRGLRLINIQLIQEITFWKKQLLQFKKDAPYSIKVKQQPIMFIYKDQNYLVKMINDNSFIFNTKFDGIKFAKQNDPFVIKPLKMFQNNDKKKLQVAQSLKQKIVQCLEILAMQKGQQIKLKLDQSKVQENYKSKNLLGKRKQTIMNSLQQSQIIDSRIKKIQNVYRAQKSSGKNKFIKRNQHNDQQEDQFDNLIKIYQKIGMARNSTQSLTQRQKKSVDQQIMNKYNKKMTNIKKQFNQMDDLKKDSQQFRIKIRQNLQFKQKSRPILKILEEAPKQLQKQRQKIQEQKRERIKNMFQKYKSMDATVKQQKTKVIALSKLKKQNKVIKQLQQKLEQKQQKKQKIEFKNIEQEMQRLQKTMRSKKKQDSPYKNNNRSVNKSESSISVNQGKQEDENGLKNLKKRIKQISGKNNIQSQINKLDKNDEFFITQLSKVQKNQSQINEQKNSKKANLQDSYLAKKKIRQAQISRIYKQKEKLLINKNISKNDNSIDNKQLRRKIQNQLKQKYKKLKSQTDSYASISINSTIVQKQQKQLLQMENKKKQLQIQIQQQQNKQKKQEQKVNQQQNKQKMEKLLQTYKNIKSIQKQKSQKVQQLKTLKNQYKKIKSKSQKKQNDNDLKNLKAKIKEIGGNKSNNKAQKLFFNKDIQAQISHISKNQSQLKQQKDQDTQIQQKIKKKIKDAQISRIYSKKERLLVKEDFQNVGKKPRKNIINGQQIKQSTNQELRKKIQNQLKQKYMKLQSQNMSRMSQQMTFNSVILQKQTKALMDAQKKRLQFQKVLLEEQLKEENELALRRMQQQAREKLEKVKQMYQQQIKKISSQYKKQNFQIKYRLEVEELRRKEKQQELSLQILKKKKLQEQLSKRGLSQLLLSNQELIQRAELQKKLLQNPNIKKQIDEYMQVIQKQAFEDLKRLQEQNRIKIEQITKKNEQQQLLQKAIEKQRFQLEKQIIDKQTQGTTRFQKLKQFYDQIEPQKKQKIQIYYQQIVQNQQMLTQQSKLKLKLEIVQELQLRQERQIIKQKIYQQQKQFKIDQIKYQYLKVLQQQNIPLEEDQKKFIIQFQIKLKKTPRIKTLQQRSFQKSRQTIIRSVKQRKRNPSAPKNQSDQDLQNVPKQKPAQIIKEVDQQHLAESKLKQDNQQKERKKTEQNKPELETIPQNQENKKIQSQNQQQRQEKSPDKQKLKSVAQSQQQILKKWNHIKPYLKPTTKKYISINDVQQYLKQFMLKQDLQFAAMIPYTEKQLLGIFKKKQVDIFDESFGWRQGDKYILIGKISCLEEISKIYGNMQVQIRMKMDGKNVHQKKYFAKRIKFFESIGYLFQKKLNDQNQYAIKILIKIPRGLNPVVRNSNKINLSLNIEMQYKNLQKAKNQNSFIFPLAKKLTNYLTQTQKLQLDKYAQNDFISKQLFKMIMHLDKPQTEKLNLDLPGLKIQQTKNQIKFALNLQLPICLSTYPCYRFTAQQNYGFNSTTIYKSNIKSPFIIMIIPLQSPKLQFPLDTYLKLLKKGTQSKQVTVWLPMWKSKRRNKVDNYGIKPFTFRNETNGSFDIGSIVQQPKGNCSVIKTPFIFCILGQGVQKYEQMSPIFGELVKEQDLIKGKDL